MARLRNWIDSCLPSTGRRRWCTRRMIQPEQEQGGGLAGPAAAGEAGGLEDEDRLAPRRHQQGPGRTLRSGASVYLRTGLDTDRDAVSGLVHSAWAAADRLAVQLFAQGDRKPTSGHHPEDRWRRAGRRRE